MSALLAKIFNGGASSSTGGASGSNATFPNDVSTMEQLCELINGLGKKTDDSTGAKAAEITRKYKDVFERRSGDIESFLLHCDPAVGSAAMFSAIKTVFDTALQKVNEVGTDRAVELLKHYLDGGQLNSQHLRMVPEITFPLIRDIVYYCSDKKKEPRIAEEIVFSALRQLFPTDEESTKYVTSCHAALFSCVLKTKNYDLAKPFLSDYVQCIYNENNAEDVSVSEEAAPSTLELGPSGSKFSRHFEKEITIKTLTKKQNNTSPPQPFMNPKYIFQYLYYGALVLIELKNYQKAMVFLETCVSIPTYQAHDLQIEAYKKYLLVSLLLKGHVDDINDKSPATVRMARSKMGGDYKHLIDVRFKRGENTHGSILAFINVHRERIEQDGNLDLLEKICVEMSNKAVLAVAKIYSSIRLSDIKDLVILETDAKVMEIIEELVNTGRLIVEFDNTTKSVIWRENLPEVSKQDVEEAAKLIEIQNKLLEEKNKTLKIHPKKSVVFMNEDEGLSMNPIEA